MLILPAIDIRGGRCVRLTQGDYGRETVFGDDPADMARRWVTQGASALHLVDLDGAKAGHPVNGDSVRAAVQASGVPCQLGGGLRSEDHVREVLDWGVARVILGTRALQDPQWLRDVCERFPGKVVLGLDARDDKLATHGWLETTEQAPEDVARKAAVWPLAGIVYTDINRDGMLLGPNLDAYARLKSAVGVPIYASGGVTSVGDVLALAKLGLAGCVVGRALYEGKFDLRGAIDAIHLSMEAAM